MSLILAIEADRRQATLLASIGRRVSAELVIAPTAERGLQAIGARIPDLILTSPLLSPTDDAAIGARLRELDASASHVQMLTIPVLAKASRRKPQGKGLLKKLRAAPGVGADGCDPSLFAEQVIEYLKRADAERHEREQALGDIEADAVAPVVEVAPAETVKASAQIEIEPAPPEPSIFIQPLVAEQVIVDRLVIVDQRVVINPVVEVDSVVEPVVVAEASAAEPTVVNAVAYEEPVAPIDERPVEEPSVEEPSAPAIVAASVPRVDAVATVAVEAAPVEEPIEASIGGPIVAEPPPVDAVATVPADAAPVEEPVEAGIVEPIVVEPTRVEAAAIEVATVEPDIAVEPVVAATAIETLIAEFLVEQPVSLRLADELLREEPPTPEERPTDAGEIELVEELDDDPGVVELNASALDAEVEALMREFRTALGASQKNEALTTVPPAEPPAAVDAIAAEVEWCEQVCADAEGEEIWAELSRAAASWPALEGFVSEARTAHSSDRDAEASVAAAPPPASTRTKATPARVEAPAPARPKATAPPRAEAPSRARQAASQVETTAAPKPQAERKPEAAAKKPAPTAQAPAEPPAAAAAAAAPAEPRKKARRKPKPVEDEWGLFDPEQCGFAALLEKLEEIASADDDAA